MVTKSTKIESPASLKPGHVSPPEFNEGVEVFRLATCTRARVLALGGELKAAICFYNGSKATLSGSPGNLTAPRRCRAYRAAIIDGARLNVERIESGDLVIFSGTMAEHGSTPIDMEMDGECGTTSERAKTACKVGVAP